MASLKSLLKELGNGIAASTASDTSGAFATFPVLLEKWTQHVAPCDGYVVLYTKGATVGQPTAINLRLNTVDEPFGSCIAAWQGGGKDGWGSAFLPVKKGQTVIYYVNSGNATPPGTTIINAQLYFVRNLAQ